VVRAEHGLPEDWHRVEKWLNFSDKLNIPPEDDLPVIKRKNPEIPVLESYEKDPGMDFWNIFPKRELPKSAETNVIGSVLKKKLEDSKESITEAQYRRGQKTVRLIENGADCAQKNPLPACMQKNAKSAVKFGEAVTDTVATWVKDGFVAGPFVTPPVGKFRVNCLMAIHQGTKVRPVLNGSLPAHLSLNSNVDPIKVERVQMCSARCFSYSVVEAGKGAHMSKMDMLNAYKNVPCVPEEYRLQGFQWLGRYFVETRQIFGAKTAVCNYDVLGNTLLELSLVNCHIPRHLVHRQLDDVPIVVPENQKSWGTEFVKTYSKTCEDVGVGLAKDDPNMDKAFSYTQKGKVLGIIFDSNKSMWAYPDDKRERVLRAIGNFMDTKAVSLLQMQQLMGRLNDVCLMAPFLKTYKGPLNEMLGWLQRHPEEECSPSKQALQDVKVWAGFLMDTEIWRPIHHRPGGPPLSHHSFTSDAAGSAIENGTDGESGVGVVGMDTTGVVMLAHQTFWPAGMCNKLDEKGARLGSKSMMLEMVGLLAPLLLIPESLANSHVVLNVDNMGCYFAWVNQGASGDRYASILVRAMVLICAYLSITIHVNHLPRMSSWEARICDRLSRKSTTTDHDRRLLNGYRNLSLPTELICWLANPENNFNLAVTLLNVVKKKIKK